MKPDIELFGGPLDGLRPPGIINLPAELVLPHRTAGGVILGYAKYLPASRELPRRRGVNSYTYAGFKSV